MTRWQSLWRNWAGNQRADPLEVVAPATADEVLAALAGARARGVPVKAVGSGHSFTAVAATDGVLLDLRRMRGLTSVDPTTRRVRALAGTPLHELNAALDTAGLALPNLGDIDRQTIAGAVATGTHGTGARFHGIAAAVSGLRLATADGSLVWCAASSTDTDERALFEAARLGLGALGVVTEVELQCVPAFRLLAREGGADLDAMLAGGADRLAEAHDHFELYWFPHTSRVLTKRNDRVGPEAAYAPLPRWRAWLDDELLSNGLFEVVNRVGARSPRLVPALAAVSARALSDRAYADASHRVRFVESEYAVPRGALAEVVGQLRDWVDRHDVAVPFPVEVRVLAGDEVWLSTAHRRDSAYVAVHQYHRRVDPRYFEAFEAIAREHGGRPHWGKLHSLGVDELAGLYARYDDFRAVRERVDPGRLFRNDYLDRVLG